VLISDHVKLLTTDKKTFVVNFYFRFYEAVCGRLRTTPFATASVW